MSTLKDIRSFIPLSKAVQRAALDMYEDFGKVESRYTAWAISGIKKITRQTLKSGKRYAILHINKSLNNAVLPVDFKEEMFVGFINECGEKIAINTNNSIVNASLIDEVPCDNQCDAQCDCYPKQLCCDLERTQVVNKIRINDTEYDQTITTTLLPTGEYFQVTTTPVMDTVESGIDYVTKKEYITKFDVEECGCIKKTGRNDCKLEMLCYEQYCCYCTNCKMSNTDFGGYQIFTENNTIQFDNHISFDKCYMEYRGSLPKKGNEYLIPEVAFETIINYTKFKSIENKKGVALWDRQYHWDRYMIERDNMTKELGRKTIADILHAALRVPVFDIDYNHCGNGCAPTSNYSTSNSGDSSSSNSIVPIPTPTPTPTPPSSCQTVITVEGSEMTGGVTYNNTSLAGLELKIFADPINRFLRATEFTVNPTGGFTTSLGPFGAGDFFEIFPIYC